MQRRFLACGLLQLVVRVDSGGEAVNMIQVLSALHPYKR